MKKYINKGTEIIFDDWCDNRKEYHSYWVEMCSHHAGECAPILGQRIDDGGSAQGTCSVYGCNCAADYYVDFAEDELIDC